MSAREKANNLQFYHEQLLISYTDAWIQRTFVHYPPYKIDTNYLKYSCFTCQSEIFVHYQKHEFPDFFCKKCQKLIPSKPDAILIRHISSFGSMVRNKLIKNSGNLEQLLQDKPIT